MPGPPTPAPPRGGSRNTTARLTAFALLDALWEGPAPLAVLDRTLRVVDLNVACAAALGVAPADAEGRTLPELADGCTAPLREEVDRIADACRVVVETGQPFVNLVARGDGPEGTPREWLCTFLPIPEAGGGTRGVVASLTDATLDREREAALAGARDDAQRALAAERSARAAEAQTRALLDGLVENAPLGIAFLDPELRFRWLNGKLAEINGLPRAAHLGRTPAELFPCLPFEEIEVTARGVLATGEPVIDYELQGEPPGAAGKRRVWLESWFPVRSGDETMGLGALVRDVTAEREADEFRRNVLGVVGHDLRTPLAALAGWAQLLARSERLPAELARLVSRILGNAARMDRIISVLLDYARLQAGQGVPLDRRACDLAAVAEAVADELRATHPGREVRLTGEGDPTGEWDPDRIAQALSNLLSNALAYSPATTLVEVRWREEGDAVCVDVSNEGPPIPGEQLARIFDPFRRAASPGARGRAQEGLGLGLFIVRAIASAHGGDATVRSAPDEGTTFTLRLPRRPAQS